MERPPFHSSAPFLESSNTPSTVNLPVLSSRDDPLPHIVSASSTPNLLPGVFQSSRSVPGACSSSEVDRGKEMLLTALLNLSQSKL